jgi:hypothetical protein
MCRDRWNAFDLYPRYQCAEMGWDGSGGGEHHQVRAIVVVCRLRLLPSRKDAGQCNCHPRQGAVFRGGRVFLCALCVLRVRPDNRKRLPTRGKGCFLCLLCLLRVCRTVQSPPNPSVWSPIPKKSAQKAQKASFSCAGLPSFPRSGTLCSKISIGKTLPCLRLELVSRMGLRLRVRA